MGAATDSYATVRSINNLFASFDELSDVTEARCAICISE